MPDRAVLFIDGNNWYHSLKENGISQLGNLNYASICSKLVGLQDWQETGYYIGQYRKKNLQNSTQPREGFSQTFLVKILESRYSLGD
jgi:hypothetical protein